MYEIKSIGGYIKHLNEVADDLEKMAQENNNHRRSLQSSRGTMLQIIVELEKFVANSRVIK